MSSVPIRPTQIMADEKSMRRNVEPILTPNEIEILRARFCQSVPLSHRESLDSILNPFNWAEYAHDDEQQLKAKISSHRLVTFKVLETAKSLFGKSSQDAVTLKDRQSRIDNLLRDWKQIQTQLTQEKQAFKEMLENQRTTQISGTQGAASPTESQAFKELSGAANSISKEFQEMYTSILKREIQRMKAEIKQNETWVDKGKLDFKSSSGDLTISPNSHGLNPKSLGAKASLPAALLSLASKLSSYQSSNSLIPLSLESELLSKLPQTLNTTLPTLLSTSPYQTANPTPVAPTAEAIISKLNQQLNRQNLKMRRQSSSEQSLSQQSNPSPQASTQNQMRLSLQLLQNKLEQLDLCQFEQDLESMAQAKSNLEEIHAHAKFTKKNLKQVALESESLLRSVEKINLERSSVGRVSALRASDSRSQAGELFQATSSSVRAGSAAQKGPSNSSDAQMGRGSPKRMQELLIPEGRYENTSYARLYGLRNRLGPEKPVPTTGGRLNAGSSPSESLLKSSRKGAKF